MRKITLSGLVLLLALSMGCATTTQKQTAAGGVQKPFVLHKKIEVKMAYQLFLPKGYQDDAKKEWPLILFLHGAGERGNDIQLVTKHGIPKIATAKPDFPFIALSPQCPEGSFWRTETVLALLDDIEAKYRVDKNRIYLTGLSMGGFGTWELACKEPNRFAAIAPICGGGNAFLASWNLKNLPVWVFHGKKDSVVPVENSDVMVNALKKINPNVKYTVYPEADHDSWTETYNNPELYTWFLSHTLSGRKKIEDK